MQEVARPTVLGTVATSAQVTERSRAMLLLASEDHGIVASGARSMARSNVAPSANDET